MSAADRKKEITSLENPLLKHIRRLLRDRTYRYARREYLIEGYKIFDSAAGVKTLVLRKGAPPPNIDLSGIDVLTVAESAFDKLSDVGAGQGVMAVCGMPEFSAPSAGGKYVFLDGLQDPGNVGTIVRTAAAFGLSGVVLGPGCADPFSPKVVRSASGALFKVPLVRCEDVNRLAIRPRIAADMDGIPLDKAGKPDTFVLVIGNEGRGISGDVAEVCDYRVSIPMPGGMESLNAATAAAIILYGLMK